MKGIEESRYELELRRMVAEEREERRALLWKNHVLYLCPDCRDGLWLPRGGGLKDSYPCGMRNCFGQVVRQRPPQFWEEDTDG